MFYTLAEEAIINNLNWAGAPGSNLAGAFVNFCVVAAFCVGSFAFVCVCE
jgi:hypothetical protein